MFVCVCDQHLLCSSSSAGSKSKALTPQWDIMAKRVSEVARPSVSLQDEVHELDWTLCGNDLYSKPRWGETHCCTSLFIPCCFYNVWLLKADHEVPNIGMGFRFHELGQFHTYSSVHSVHSCLLVLVKLMFTLTFHKWTKSWKLDI